jgi:hypothetical protein
MDEMGYDGGRGSCLAVTAQSVGDDNQWWTSDDVYDADLNSEPAIVSADLGVADGVEDAFDRVRPFVGLHPGGAVFSHADGSVHFVDESIERRTYIIRSHIKSGEVLSN